MISVSVAIVYYAAIKWTLPNIVINSWQVFLGVYVLRPFMSHIRFCKQPSYNHVLVFSFLVNYTGGYRCFATMVLPGLTRCCKSISVNFSMPIIWFFISQFIAGLAYTMAYFSWYNFGYCKPCFGTTAKITQAKCLKIVIKKGPLLIERNPN